MTRTTLAVTVTIVVSAIALAAGTVAAAQTGDLDIDIDGITRGDPGETVPLETVDTPADLVGQVCQIELVGANNPSVHPNNDLHVTTGGSTLTLADIEAVADNVGAATGTLTLGPVLTVAVTLGADGLSSGGYALMFDCQPTTTTTTTTDATTTTTTVPATVPPWTRPPGGTIPPTRTRPPTPGTPDYTG